MAAANSARPPVFISGAGPTGLLLAVWLHRLNVPLRIVDKAPRAGMQSRAIAMQARTLEIYRMLGLDEEAIDLGARMVGMTMWHEGVQRGGVDLDRGGAGISYFAQGLSITQDEHEEFLEKYLAKHGVHVEREVEVLGVDTARDGEPDRNPIVTIRHFADNREEQLEASYVAGCDGAHSGVRHAMGVKMEGGTYPRPFFVADVMCSGPMAVSDRLNMCISGNELVALIPLPHQPGRARVTGFVPIGFEDENTPVTFEDIQPSIMQCLPHLEINKVQWFVRYRVHHRCADRFQIGKRVFLCGDSAHIHSPVGGQGMNTGLGDATNLAWKLATVWHGDGHGIDADTLLASYEAERRPFAVNLVNTNDSIFSVLVSLGWQGRLMRHFVFPYVIPFLGKFSSLTAVLFRRVSQTAIAYLDSPLSQCAGGKSVLPGMRLPWVEDVVLDPNTKKSAGAARDNHSLLQARGWQAHIYSNSTADTLPEGPDRECRIAVEKILRNAYVPLHQLRWNSRVHAAGLEQDKVYLIRPDGHIGLALGLGSIEEVCSTLEKYMEQWGVGMFSR